MGALIDLPGVLDDGKCFELVRQHRWQDGIVVCPACGGDAVRNGHDDTQPQRRRYLCKGCHARFDDLTGTVLAGHHQPVRMWILCLYFMGLNLSNLQIAAEPGLNAGDVQDMATALREGIAVRAARTLRAAPQVLSGEVEMDEVHVVAGHKGNPAAVQKKPQGTPQPAQGRARTRNS